VETGGREHDFRGPQGIGNAWNNGGGSDVEFSRALITQLKSQLCIDTTRIFAEGFSMGGSMSYAVACAMSDIFRAVAVHSGGPMSGCDKSNRKPVAYFMTHGNKDSVCKYPDYGIPQIDDIAQVNGCQILDIENTLKPTDSSGKTPVCGDFQGCLAGHPARACLFVGDHTPSQAVRRPPGCLQKPGSSSRNSSRPIRIQGWGVPSCGRSLR